MSQNRTKHLNIMPVILAGGMGKRLWPFTAPHRPKPFLRGFHDLSLFQQTLNRASLLAPPFITTHADYAPMVFEQCYETGIKPHGILCEPVHRNTAIGIACAAITAEKNNMRMLVMPSDHDIADTSVFYDLCDTITKFSHDFICVTTKPTSLSSRYGYIVSDKDSALIQFIEKPNRQTILTLAKHGHVAWNTGIFYCKPAALLNILNHHYPQIYQSAQNAMKTARHDKPFLFPDIDAYLNARPISNDYAVMQNVKENAMTLPLETAWHDIGTRSAYIGYMMKNLYARVKRLS